MAFGVLAGQITVIFLEVLLGYVGARSGIIKDRDSKFLSDFIMKLLLPCIMLAGAAVDGEPELLTQAGVLFVLLLALFVVTIYFPKLEKYVQILCMIPYTIQGVILSVSILSVYGKSGTVFGQRMVMLIGAYCIIILPHIYQGIRNSMHAISMPMLIEAAEMLGASRLYAFFRVIVPNIISGITVSSLLAVGILFGDYVIIRNLSGSGTTNLQIYLYQAMKRSTNESSAVIVIIMLLTFAITALVLYMQSNSTLEKIKREGR